MLELKVKITFIFNFTAGIAMDFRIISLRDNALATKSVNDSSILSRMAASQF